MISSILLNSEAVLNNFFVHPQYVYTPGENLDLVIRLIHRELDIRYIAIDPSAIITLSFDVRSTTVPLDIVATEVAPLDRSMWKASLTQAQTLDLSGSNILVTLDELGDGTIIYKTVISLGLLRTTLSGDC